MTFIVVRRWGLVALAVVLAAITGLSVVAKSSVVAASGSGCPVVVVDAGHGGVDGGVVAPLSKAKESELNLLVAKSLKHILKKNGYGVVMTRKTEGGLYSTGEGSKKLSDMRKRKEIINSACPDLVVSVHQNFYPSPVARGAQVFYRAGDEESKRAASFIQSSLNDGLGGTREIKGADYYVLTCSDYPSVLVECGFLSNAEEERLLLSAEYRERLSYALYVGVAAFFDYGGAESGATP